jgi:hypothetical protein
VLGAAPKAVGAPEKILDLVANWVWISSPMTLSHCMYIDLSKKTKSIIR